MIEIRTVGIVMINPDFKIAMKKSNEENIFIKAKGIQPINDELRIRNAKVIDNVIEIIFLSIFGLSLL